MSYTIHRNLIGHSGSVNAVRFTHDGNYCMTASDDRTVKLWNPHKDDPSKSVNDALTIKTYSGTHGYGILDVAITMDNSRFASCGEDKAAFLSDVSTGRVIRRFQGHTQRINSIDLDDNGTVLLTGSYDKTISCWDLRANNRDPMQILSDFKDSVSSVRHSNKGLGYIIASSVDGKIRIYDMRYGKLHNDNHTNPITCVRLSNDNKTYISCCLGDTIRLSDVASGQLLRTYKGHKHRSYKIEACMTPDDKHIICGDETGNIYSWDILTTNITHKTNIPVHNRGISCISHHPKEQIILTSSYDSTVKCFKY